MVDESDDKPLEARLAWPSDLLRDPGPRVPAPRRNLPAEPTSTSLETRPGRVEHVPSAEVEALQERVEALSHALLAMHGVVVDRLSQQADEIAAVRREQARMAAAIERLQPERPASSEPGSRVDAIVTGMVRGWRRFQELRGRPSR